jgi:hypothetical protein
VRAMLARYERAARRTEEEASAVRAAAELAQERKPSTPSPRPAGRRPIQPLTRTLHEH